MADPKTRKTDASVEDFLNNVPDEQKRADCFALLELMRDITGEPPAMWGASIVGFGAYHYTYASGREGDWPLAGFAPRQRDLTIYIMAGFGQSAELLARLGRHRTGKSCLYIKRLSDIDVRVLKKLVATSVKRMKQAYD